MNIPKIEEAITLLYQTHIEDQDVATQRGIAITAMNEMVKLLGGADVVAKIEAVPYSARVRSQHLFEDDPKREWVGLTIMETAEIVKTLERGNFLVAIQNIEAKLKEKNT